MATLRPPVNNTDHIKGDLNAPATLVEFGDYQCPYCGASHPVLKEIEKQLDDRLLFVYRHFPLSNIHAMAVPAAMAAEAAGRQGKFWAMHDLIFDNQDVLMRNDVLIFARQLGLNIARFKIDLLDKSLSLKIESDFESGVRSGVNGTPSFFINGTKHNGPSDFVSLLAAIEDSMGVNQ